MIKNSRFIFTLILFGAVLLNCAQPFAKTEPTSSMKKILLPTLTATLTQADDTVLINTVSAKTAIPEKIAGTSQGTDTPVAENSQPTVANSPSPVPSETQAIESSPTVEKAKIMANPGATATPDNKVASAPTATIASISTTPTITTATPITVATTIAVNSATATITSTNSPVSPTITHTPAPVAESTATPTATPIPQGHFNPNKGVLLSYRNCEDLDPLGAGWYFTNDINVDCPAFKERFVPRIYGLGQVNDENALKTAINNAKASGWLLGYVEPNLLHQNITPIEGAKGWRKIEQAALSAGIKLASPSVSQHDPGYFDPLGYTWIWKMVEEYQNLYGEKPHFDAMSWNYYNSSPQATKDYLTARHDEAKSHGYNVPFWVTEYAGKCWDSDKFPTGNDNIMNEITPWLESNPWIDRYAWFANRVKGTEPWAKNHQSCSLFDPNSGKLTSLGNRYAKY